MPITQDQATQTNAQLAELNRQIARLNQTRGYNLPGVQGTLSPTVLSNENIINDTIPNIKSRADSYLNQSSTNQTTDTNKSNDYADILAQTWKSLGIDPNATVSPKQQQLYDLMKSETDAQAQAALASIHNQYNQLYQQQQRSQQSTGAKLENLLLTGGGAHTASSGLVLDAKTNADLQDMAALQDRERAGVASVQAAQAQQNFQLMGKRLDALDKVRADKLDLANQIAKVLYEQNKSVQEKNIQSSRDQAIGGLMSQGVTDPLEMLDYLNFDENGKKIGDFTAEEIYKTMKNLTGQTDTKTAIEQLTGETKNFYMLKNIPNALPESITSLPESEQLWAYLQQNAAVRRAPRATTAGPTLSLAEVQKYGLPYSLIGMGERQIFTQLNQTEAPNWFREKAYMEARQTLIPEALQTLWDDFRNKTLSRETTLSERRPSASLVGQVRALRNAGASEDEINEFISISGYDPNQADFQNAPPY